MAIIDNNETFSDDIKFYMELLLDTYVTITKNPVGLFYPDGNAYYPKDSLDSFTDYCKAVRTTQKGKDRCEEDHLRRAKANIGLNVCYAGVWNFCRKFYVKDKHIATMLYGQKRIHGQKYADKTSKGYANLCQFLSLNKSEMSHFLNLLNKIEEVDERDLEPEYLGNFIKFEEIFLKALEDKITIFHAKETLANSFTFAWHHFNTMAEGLNSILDYIRNNYSKNNEELCSLLESGRNILLGLHWFATKFGISPGDFELQEVNVRACVDKCVKFYDKKARDKNIRLEVNGNFPTILASKNYFEQMLFNLLENALKYSYNGWSSPDRYITISGISEFDYFELAIEDYGIGFNEDEKEKIFESGYQSKRRKGEKRMGSGMGLTIAKSIIDDHNGFIYGECHDLQGGASKVIFHALFPLKYESYKIEEIKMSKKGK